MNMNDFRFESTSLFDLSKRHAWQNAFHVSHNVNLSDLPYFRLRDMFNSAGTYLFLITVEVSKLNFKRCKEGI
jgi:hypothetical protein